MANVVKNILHPGDYKWPASFGLLLLRIGIGGTTAVLAGWPHFMDYTRGADHFPDWLGVGPQISLAAAVFFELVCGALVTFGALTRFAAACLCFYVGMQVFRSDVSWAAQQQQLIQITVFTTLLFVGAGRISLDEFFFRNK